MTQLHENRYGDWGPKPEHVREEEIDDVLVLYRSDVLVLWSDGTSPHPEGSGGQVFHLSRQVFTVDGSLLSEPDGWVDGGVTVARGSEFQRAHSEADKSLGRIRRSS